MAIKDTDGNSLEIGAMYMVDGNLVRYVGTRYVTAFNGLVTEADIFADADSWDSVDVGGAFVRQDCAVVSPSENGW